VRCLVSVDTGSREYGVVDAVGARKKAPVPPQRPVVALDDGTLIGAVLAEAAQAARDGATRALEFGIDRLSTAPQNDVNTAMDAACSGVLAALFERGWAPADVVRATDPAHRAWAAALIRRQMSRYPSDRVAPRWAMQLAELPDDPAPAERHDAIRARVQLLGVLNYLPGLPLLMPPPGVARSAAAGTGTSRTSASAPAGGLAADGRMLAKIRALLAKAESTTFPDEADAYSAKAQELMTQHRIGQALIMGEVANPGAPIGVRLTVEAPYPAAKALLLQVVADANGCQSLWSEEHGFSTVFGFADELEAVELVYTSLLVQGNAAMIREGSARHDTSARTKTFRQSFMNAYAIRIGDRLHATAALATDQAAEADTRLLPVLASRERAVQRQVEQVFPGLQTKSRSIRVDSEDGWRRGTLFADRASLTA